VSRLSDVGAARAPFVGLSDSLYGLDTVSGEADIQLCPSCAYPNEIASQFCTHGSAPLSPHVTTDPMGRIYSEGHAWRRAARHPRKLIVVIGMWFFWGPAVLLGGGLFFLGLWSLHELSTTFQWHGGEAWYDSVLTVVVLLVGFGGFGYIGAVLLYRTTRNYAEKRRSRHAHDE